MKHFKTVTAIVFLSYFLIGCAAMFVSATNDPKKKLDQAYDLIQYQERPLPAEKLIRESIEIYEKDNDLKGLANAYWTYGVFFQSNAVKKLERTYIDNGFIEKSVTYENRYEKSNEFFGKAEAIAEKHNNYELLANISWNRAFNYKMTGNLNKACKEYSLSLERNQERQNTHPESTYFIPGKGDVSFKEYKEIFLEFMKSSGCQ